MLIKRIINHIWWWPGDSWHPLEYCAHNYKWKQGHGCCNHATSKKSNTSGVVIQLIQLHVKETWCKSERFYLAFSLYFNVYWVDFFIDFRPGDGFNNLHHSPEKVQLFFFSIFITSFYQSLISQCNTGLQAATTVRSTTGGLQTHHLLRLSNYLAFYCWMCCCWLA